ncbi:hypothetical protein [Pseudorhodobacter sp.]|uniref:hypothetical protein n=1 Tax=Pseudorhodobacter sp. TaxID=1934400 RepID=UPI002AFE3992|nr:hypothetical protein [Pseudorhodobacter sp.]
MGKAFNDKVVALTGRLPQIWADPATTDTHRKALLRCLVEKVVIDRGTHDIALARIVWRGGAVTELEVKMQVNSLANLARGDEMRDRILELAQAGVPDDEIANGLTSEGHRSPNCADKVLPVTVQRIRSAAGIKVADQRHRWHHDPDLLTANELASRLGIPVNWLYVQIRKRQLLIERQPSGAYLFPDAPSVLDAVRSLRNHTISSLDLRINKPDKEGHQHE